MANVDNYWASPAVLQALTGWRGRIATIDDSPLVGIWWDDGTTLAAFAHSINQGVSCLERLIDSNLEHWREWPKVCSKFGKLPSDEYFDVPRGRVIHDAGQGRSVIYHGSATPPERLPMIAKAFGLDEWIAAVDLHYEMGDAIDELFDEEAY